MSLREELQAIYESNGKLTPTIVVDVARSADHPLHSRFNWDDTDAAECWRRDQAKRLIRSVRITYRTPNEKDSGASVRAFQAVHTEEGNVFKPSEEVVQDEFLTKLVLSEMTRDWQALKRRYERFAEFTAMIRKDIGAA